MKLTFDNGYEVSIMDKNEYVLTPEVGVMPPCGEGDFVVMRFDTADALTDILNEIKKL
jgi:hypothetical protein|tara:strand:+ start:233 stop:406 length:174 start_codon:yes stop_codon:yes gene_type:complete